MTLNETATPQDRALILKIADRAMADGPSPYTNKIRAVMDLTILHLNGCPLDLAALADASETNFWHDLNGIAANLDRATAQLKHMFHPRHAVQQNPNPRDKPKIEIQLIDFTRTGTAFNAYLVTPSANSPCDWGQAPNMTRAEAIKLARSKGYEPTVRNAHQVWLQPSLTSNRPQRLRRPRPVRAGANVAVSAHQRLRHRMAHWLALGRTRLRRALTQRTRRHPHGAWQSGPRPRPDLDPYLRRPFHPR